MGGCVDGTRNSRICRQNNAGKLKARMEWLERLACPPRIRGPIITRIDQARVQRLAGEVINIHPAAGRKMAFPDFRGTETITVDSDDGIFGEDELWSGVHIRMVLE